MKAHPTHRIQIGVDGVGKGTWLGRCVWEGSGSVRESREVKTPLASNQPDAMVS